MNEEDYEEEEFLAELDRFQRESGHGPPIVTTPFLDRYMPHISDDWIDIFGFKNFPKNRSEVRCWRADGYPLNDVIIPVEAEYAFYNVDAAFWSVFSENSDELESIRATWPTHSRLLSVERVVAR